MHRLVINQVHIWKHLALFGFFYLMFLGCNRLDEKTRQEVAQWYQSCLICHSTKEMQRGPILDGLDAWYLSQQIKKFRDGLRGTNPQNKAELLMTPIAKTWTDDRKIQLLSQYISELTPQKHIASIKGDKELGKQLYQTCIPCHGEEAQGKRLLSAPSLHHLEGWYIVMQLKAFKTKRRGYHPKDIHGQQMVQATSHLNGKDFNNLAAYITSIQ